MLNPIITNFNLSNEEYQIYARQLILDNIGFKGQYRLKKAKVLLVGSGGLGCPAIVYLASSGIGYIGVIDHDIISKSNLPRQILYTIKNIHELKTILTKKIKEINPFCEVSIYSEKFTQSNAYQLVQKYDLVLDTSDNFPTRYLINMICYKLHKPYIYGAVQSFEGHISVFNYQSGPTYSDLYPKYTPVHSNTCDNIGILGVIPGIIGILQTTEALKIILGIGRILSGYLLIYNGLDMSFKKVKIQPIKTNKPALQYDTNELSISKTIIINSYYLKNMLNQKQKKEIFIIDVRQKAEFNKKHIISAVNIPLKEIKTKKNINLIYKLSSDSRIILYCSHNSRSIIASYILAKYNIYHYRLKDGLYTWTP
uniref:Molybdopterin biosynthesis protein n=1 Tax=Dicranema revolutum TaxID=239144 RepID=A0A4D6WRV4_9FLOR|nr:Molybdopterin biosynthesis protein [Dicranema revolutum]